MLCEPVVKVLADNCFFLASKAKALAMGLLTISLPIVLFFLIASSSEWQIAIYIII